MNLNRLAAPIIFFGVMMLIATCKKTVSTPQLTPAITGLSAFSGLPNSVITINGTNFTAGVANNTVSLNSVPATILSATSTQVVFIVPPNAGTDKIKLTTNGRVLVTNQNFSSYKFADGGYIPNFYSRHMATGTGIYISAVTDLDTIGYQYESISGANNQYVGFMGGLFLAAPAQTQLWGIVYSGGYQYAAGYNDYKIYKCAGTTNSATVFAGSGVQGFADGQGTAAQFTAPRGMAKDTLGNIYVNDVHRIRKITPSGMVSTFAGSGADGDTNGQGTAATFGNLYDIAIDAAGNLYVTDSEFPVIRKITPTGTVSTFAGNNVPGLIDGNGIAAQFYGPKGITVDFSGNILVSDSNFSNATTPFTAAIRMINAAGTVTTLLNSSKGDILGNPGSICFSGAQLYICSADMPGPHQQAVMMNYTQQ